MRYIKHDRFWGFCFICKDDMKQITTSKEHPNSHCCDDCKSNRKLEYEIYIKNLVLSQEEKEKLRIEELNEKESTYYRQLEKEDEHYTFLAENDNESYDDWLSSEFGEDEGGAYWNNE